MTKKINAEMRGVSFAQNSVNSTFSELLPVTFGGDLNNAKATVNARSLHQVLGVGRDFNTWIKARIESFQFEENTDYLIVESLSTPKRGSAKFRQQVQHDYILDLDMAKELAMVERTEQGRAIRKYFIECEKALHEVAPLKVKELKAHLKARMTASDYYPAMCAALQLARMEQGKETNPRHYTNESNMINRIVLGGMTANEWNKANQFTGKPRDNMTVEQLEHIGYLEQRNITLIELGMDYEERNRALSNLSQKYLSKLIGVADDD